MQSEDMSPEEHQDELEWRDTYFILFQRADRPTLTQVEAAIAEAAGSAKLENLQADEDGMFESILIQAPEDHAALEVSYETGEAVVEQSLQLAEQLKGDGAIDSNQLARLLNADARLDVMHFERVETDFLADDDEDFMPDSLDPASLLTVVEVLTKLTGGLPIDPGSGALMS